MELTRAVDQQKQAHGAMLVAQLDKVLSARGLAFEQTRAPGAAELRALPVRLNALNGLTPSLVSVCFSFLSAEDHVKVSLTCKRFRSLAIEPRAWDFRTLVLSLLYDV